MKLRILGLDIAPSATGVAWSCDHNGRYAVGCRTVHTGRLRGHDRTHAVLMDVAAAVACKPHLAVIEGLYVGKLNNTLPLAGLRAVVCHWLWTKGVPYVDVAPATLKVWAAGRGNTSGENRVTKQEVREAVTAAYGQHCHIGDDNAADAMALLSMGLAAYSQPLADVPDTHRRALKVPAWPSLDPPPGGAAEQTAAGRGQGAQR